MSRKSRRKSAEAIIHSDVNNRTSIIHCFVPISYVFHCLMTSFTIINLIATYRDVPTRDELETNDLLIPNLAENAEALIDFALSHIPRRKSF